MGSNEPRHPFYGYLNTLLDELARDIRRGGGMSQKQQDALYWFEREFEILRIARSVQIGKCDLCSEITNKLSTSSKAWVWFTGYMDRTIHICPKDAEQYREQVEKMLRLAESRPTKYPSDKVLAVDVLRQAFPHVPFLDGMQPPEQEVEAPPLPPPRSPLGSDPA